MDNEVLAKIGSWACRALDVAGLVPDSCLNVSGRGTIGLIASALMVALLVLVAWRRFL